MSDANLSYGVGSGGGGGGNVTVVSSALPTGAATQAAQDVLNAKIPDPVSGALPVTGPLTDAQLRASVVPVSPNVSRGGGVVDANTQRVTLATDGPGVANLASIATTNASMDGKIPALGAAENTAALPTVLANKRNFAGLQYAAGAAVVNLDLLTGAASGWLDVSTYNSAVLTITTGAGISAGVLQFEETNSTTVAPNGTLVLGHNTVSQNTNPISAITLAASQTTSVYLPLRAKYFRCRVSTAVAGGTVQAVITMSQLPFSPTNRTINQSTAASLNATIATLPAGTNLIGSVGVQYPANATGAASFVSVISPATPAAATIKATAGRVVGWQLQNSAAALRSVKVFGVASPTLGTTAALFEIDIPAGGTVFMNFPGGLAFGTAATYSVTSAKGLTDNTATGLVLGDVSGAFYFA